MSWKKTLLLKESVYSMVGQDVWFLNGCMKMDAWKKT